MKNLFRRIPFPAKLILIGLVPLGFLVALSFQVYKEKTDKLLLLEGYIERIELSANISAFIDALQTERKISFDYALRKAKFSDLFKHRPITDTAFLKLERSNDQLLKGFKDYTSLFRLNEVRAQIDSGKMNSSAVMHYYSNTIFRLNTLNAVSLPNNPYLEPAYKDLVAQKLLTEMITYLGIIRSNIYNVLYTRKYMVETLFGITGTHDVYKSFEKEFLIKASPEALNAYQQIKNGTDLKHMTVYLDTLFKNFSFDTTYTADQWWIISNNGLNELSALQQSIWRRAESQIKSIHGKEVSNRANAILLLVFILILVLSLITYTIIFITKTLKQLKHGARKIAKGETNVQLPLASNDALGALTNCIHDIDNNNRLLAEAADAIGKGDFGVEIRPRSPNDVLGTAIVRMKNSLEAYSEKMEALVKQRTEELERSNKDLQQFAHVASHDLKEPLRKLRVYISLLMKNEANVISDTNKTVLSKIDQAATRMTTMVDGILTYSSTNAAVEHFELVDLNKILNDITSDLELLIQEKNASVNFGKLPKVEGAPVLLNQLFYNLLNNSLKFSRKDVSPVINIECRRLNCADHLQNESHDCYEIIVEDNGIGFEPEYAEQIFETFSRLHSKTEYEGTGLGLALCRKIVDYHNGKIWAESKGQGSAFRIILPQKQNN
jgi:signal transduction histidine kinase